MTWRLMADLTVLVHTAFVLFVVTGGFAVWRWPRLIWLHLPAAVWGFLIEIAGWACPLTHLENSFRLKAGQAGYPGGFVEHYVLPVLYPEGLTRGIQWGLAAFVLGINGLAYGLWLRRRSAGRKD